MLTRIAMLLNGLNMARFTQALASVKERLCKLVSNLRVSFTQAFQNVVSLFSRLRVQIASSFNRLPASQTIVAPLTKQGRSTAKAKATQAGSQPQTTVRQTRRRATTTSKKSKGLVAKIKLALSRINESKTVQILMAHKLTQAGLRLLEAARQRLQRVQRQLFKGR